MQTIEVTLSQIPEILAYCHAAKLHPFVMGQPGVGKSDAVAAYARSIKAEFVDARLAYYAPQDVQGFPYLDTNVDGLKTMRFSLPAFWPKSNNYVIALEEFNCATKSVQNVALQLLNEGRVGDHILPEGGMVCLLGNRHEDRVNIEKLSSAVVDRIVDIRVRIDLDSWIKWAVKAGLDPMVTAFIRFRPDLLTTFDGKKWDGVSSFATPRGWEKVSRLMLVATDKNARYAILNGIVGAGAAAEFSGFCSIKLPDLDDILLNPDKGTVPTDPSTIYAVCAGLAKRVKPKSMANLLVYLDRLPKEFSVFGLKTAVNYNKSLMNTEAFIKWVNNNQEVFA